MFFLANLLNLFYSFAGKHASQPSSGVPERRFNRAGTGLTRWKELRGTNALAFLWVTKKKFYNVLFSATKLFFVIYILLRQASSEAIFLVVCDPSMNQL